MRILHVLDHSLPLQSGYVSRTLGIVNEQRARKWEPILMTTPRQNRGAIEVEEFSGWRFHRTPAPNGLLSRTPVVNYMREMQATARRLSALIDEVKPDIVHAHSPALNGLPALWAAHPKGVPVVYEVRALWEEAGVEAGTVKSGSLRYRASRSLESYVLNHADAVAVLCQGVRDDVLSRGLPESKLVTIPNAVDVANFSPERRRDAALAAKLGLDDAVVIGFIGSFYEYEGLDLLLQALPQTLARIPNLKLLLVGGGPHEAELKRLTAEAKLDNAVIFTGRVPFAEVERYYDLVDLFVYPRRKSRLTDLVTPLKPIEAMAKQRVVIASDCGGHKEIVTHGVNGLLFAADNAAALSNAITGAVANRDAWAAMGETARDYVLRERTWAASVNRYEPVYERLAAPRRKARAA
ncbi:MAG: glycosyltransferase, exosortase A system-associated [Alphaproteobacteria bacterium]|nr:glycosyltransferase, exosortase A system-associated [Alphaproteobacteria bacterium]